jgi:hypothetical protein
MKNKVVRLVNTYADYLQGNEEVDRLRVRMDWLL